MLVLGHLHQQDHHLLISAVGIIEEKVMMVKVMAMAILLLDLEVLEEVKVYFIS